MFGSAALVWVLLMGETRVGYFKSKEACMDAFKQAVIVFDSGERPYSKQANSTSFALCVPVETPLPK